MLVKIYNIDACENGVKEGPASCWILEKLYKALNLERSYFLAGYVKVKKRQLEASAEGLDWTDWTGGPNPKIWD